MKNNGEKKKLKQMPHYNMCKKILHKKIYVLLLNEQI